MQRLLKLIPLLAVACLLQACTAEVEDTGSPPDVDVTGGDLPSIDVDPIQIPTDTQVIRVDTARP